MDLEVLPVSKKHKKHRESNEEQIAREEAERFEELVDEALANLPPAWAERMENVQVAIEAWPSPDVLQAVGLGENDALLGYYHGVPQTERTTAYGAVLPDRIEIYREPTLDEADATCPEDGDFEATIRDIIRTTVLHEIGHHFGLSDEDLKRLDYE
jgi:predicted Zn-dependent protease with MMP-like domain